jgi:hypothetical protein
MLVDAKRRLYRGWRCGLLAIPISRGRKKRTTISYTRLKAKCELGKGKKGKPKWQELQEDHGIHSTAKGSTTMCKNLAH